MSTGATAARDLFALTDEQILQIEPEAQDVEVFAGERTDSADPLREDLNLLSPPASNDRSSVADSRGQNSTLAGNTATSVATVKPPTQNSETDAATNSSAEVPAWLTERMNDPQNGAEARALWTDVQTTRQEASAFREVFVKPEDARAAAERAKTLDDFDRAYFGVTGSAPEQLSASRAELASKMLREDPAAFREMVFAGLRALESAAQQGTGPSPNTAAESITGSVAPPFSLPSGTKGAASSASTPAHASPHQSVAQQASASPRNAALQQHETQPQPQQDPQRQESRVAAYAAFERATNADLERGVGGAIDRSLQAALPNASRSENGAALKERLSAAIRVDVEKSLQSDRALSDQVARILSGQRLDDAARVQVVRLISERAQQLVPGAARKVLADWTQTTLASHSHRAERIPAQRTSTVTNVSSNTNVSTRTPQKSLQANDRSAVNRQPRKIDYRRVSDNDILDF
jgi:hypothetical protein